MTETPNAKGGKVKAFFGRIGGFIKRHKVLTVILVIVLILAVIIVNLVSNVRKAAESLMSTPQTLTLEKMNLEQVVAGNGTVQSATARQVSTALTSKITQVAVEEGAYVNPGDILCQLDTTDVDKSIADTKKDMAKARASDKINLDAAQRRLDDAIRQRSADETNYNRKIKEAGDAVNAARAVAGNTAMQVAANAALPNDAAVLAAQDALNTAQVALTTAQTNVAIAEANAIRTQAEYEAAITSGLDPLIGAHVIARDDAQTALTTAQGALDDPTTGAQIIFNNAQTALDGAKLTAYNAFVNNSANQYLYNNAYNSANVSIQQSAYDTAVEMRDNSLRASDSAIASAREGLALQRLADSAAPLKIQLEKLEKDREESTITAPIAGTVIEVKAEVGLSPSASISAGADATTAAAAAAGGSSLFTIKDEGSLEIIVNVPEYDAVSLSLNLPATITTDALTGQEWSGIVTNISPAATDDKSNFRVTISVTSAIEKLAIGMSAKVNVATDSISNVFAVPYDTVTTDASGQNVVYVYDPTAPAPALAAAPASVASGTETAAVPQPQGKAIPVSTGMETDYYIEISGDGLEEGMVLLADPEGKNVATFDAQAFMFG